MQARGGARPIRRSAIFACGLVEEASTHDSRLALATVRAARRAGAVTLNYTGAAAIERVRSVSAIAVVDGITGEQLTVRSRAVINASGPWVDRVRLLEDPRAKPLTRLSKGVHAVLPLPDGWQAGLALFDDARSAFAVPWQGMLLLGATDTPVDDDALDAPRADEDVAMLLGWFRDVLPDLRADRVVSSFAGFRVLAPGRAGTARASRRHVIDVGPGGTVSIAGGKLTNHRAIALDALANLPPEVRPSRLRLSADPLPGALHAGARATVKRRVDARTAAHLLGLYGGEAVRVLAFADTEPNALEPIHRDGPDIWAQAYFAVDEEMAVKAEDIAARRTTLGLRGLASAQVLDELGRLLGSGPEDARAGSGARPDLSEDPEARLAERQLVELGVHAAEVVLATLVAALHLDPAHRQRPLARTHRAEFSALLGLEHQQQVDLHAEHLLHAADVGPPHLDERVEERAPSLDACRGIDHLVAMNVAAPALDLVLWVERELLRNDLKTPHRPDIVGADHLIRKT